MSKITQRDLVETIIGLRGMASDMKAMASHEPISGIAPSAVLITVSRLLDSSQYLSMVADELLELVPDCPPPVPPKE